MKIQIDRETLLRPLQQAASIVERRQTRPILGHVLIDASEERLTLTAGDGEIELIARIPNLAIQTGSTTVPIRKLYDIVRSLPANLSLGLSTDGPRATLSYGRSRTQLSTLPADDYPGGDQPELQAHLQVNTAPLRKMLQTTSYAMASQDVRYYLNGLLLEATRNHLRTIGTDGHRLAYAHLDGEFPLNNETPLLQPIVPRKAVIELQRLLADAPEQIEIGIGLRHLQITTESWTFTSRLIDGRYPDYHRVIPTNNPNLAIVPRLELIESLGRAAVVSSDRSQAVRLKIEPWNLTVSARNNEQDEIEEHLEIHYDGPVTEIAFNLQYLNDALNNIDHDTVQLHLSGSFQSTLITVPEEENYKAVIMPMRL